MSNYFIGIMTGTSADSLDGCIVNFKKNVDLIETAQIELGSEYKDKYEECIRLGFKEVNESADLMEVEKTLNKKTIDLIETLIDKSRISRKSISLIALSGQTIFHTYEKSYQIGNSQQIADMTGINVCSNFRNFDIQQGGMGAPLIPAFHKYLYAENNKNKLIFNIGGISNGTYLDGEKIVAASDIGPGNCLLDLVMTSLQLGDYDKDGEIASNGAINHLIKDELMTSFMNMAYPRADDITAYIEPLLKSFEEYKAIPVNELLRTLVEVTAEKIKELQAELNLKDLLVWSNFPGIKHKDAMKSIKLFNEEVIPKINAGKQSIKRAS